MLVNTPPTFQFYCRTCREATWFVPNGVNAACQVCGRVVAGAEVVTTYCTDDYTNPATLLVPSHALPPRVQVYDYTTDEESYEDEYGQSFTIAEVMQAPWGAV
jgi:hypothetical protein